MDIWPAPVYDVEEASEVEEFSPTTALHALRGMMFAQTSDADGESSTSTSTAEEDLSGCNEECESSVEAAVSQDPYEFHGTSPAN